MRELPKPSLLEEGAVSPPLAPMSRDPLGGKILTMTDHRLHCIQNISAFAGCCKMDWHIEGSFLLSSISSIRSRDIEITLTFYLQPSSFQRKSKVRSPMFDLQILCVNPQGIKGLCCGDHHQVSVPKDGGSLLGSRASRQQS